MKRIKEDYRNLTQKIDVEDEDVRTQINSMLSQALSEPFLTPYIALERINKILTVFHITIPSSTMLDGDHGYKTFGVSQFGDKFGMTNTGETMVKKEGSNSVFMEYGMNEEGTFDVFCEIVTKEELDEILADIEEEKESCPHCGKDSCNCMDIKEAEENKKPEVKSVGLARVKAAMGKTAKVKSLDQRVAEVTPKTPDAAPKPKKTLKRVLTPNAVRKARPTPHTDRTDRFDTAWNQSIKTVGAPHLKHSEYNHYHPENQKLLRDHARADMHTMAHGKNPKPQSEIDAFHHKTNSMIRDSIHHWTTTAKYDDIEHQVSKGNIDPDSTVLNYMHAAAKVEYGVDSDKAKHDNRMNKINNLSTLVHGSTEKKGWFGKRTVIPNKIFKEEKEVVATKNNVTAVLETMNKQYRKK